MDRWSQLGREARFAVALDVARRQGRRLMRAFPNVVSVGAGFRSRSESRNVVDEVCLRFLVRGKWKSRRARAGRIPPYIRAGAMLGRRKIVVSIPTDVSEFRGGAPHAALDLSGGITSRKRGRQIDYGASCCLVRNADSPGERYLLSCYHVFAPGLDEPPGDIDCVASPGDRRIGPMLEVADPYARSNALDAALVLVEDGQVDALPTWGRRPISHATDFDLQSLHENARLFVHARRVAPESGGLPAATRPGPLAATFQSLFPNPTPFDYRQTAGRTVLFADTLQYVADVRPGDSGSALMDEEGKLFGMHFYGLGNVGFAFAAPRLFDPGVFPFDIVLA
jgi:hypothetical protein